VYCSHCGAAATGNFCAACGHPLSAGAPIAPVATLAPAVATVTDVAPGSWDDEVRYEVIVAVPTVRDMIAANAAAAKTPYSAEKFLALADKAFQPVAPGLSLATVASIAGPMYARMGVRTGQTRSQTYARPIGRLLADVLCALAANGYGVTQVQQGTDGCILQCSLPSDWRSWAGEMVVDVERAPGGASVRAATKIPGQLYDWGKSKQALERIFARL
jgi:hypothetical protein